MCLGIRIHTGVELPGHGVGVCSTLVDNAREFSQVVEPVYASSLV